MFNLRRLMTFVEQLFLDVRHRLAERRQGQRPLEHLGFVGVHARRTDYEQYLNTKHKTHLIKWTWFKRAMQKMTQIIVGEEGMKEEQVLLYLYIFIILLLCVRTTVAVFKLALMDSGKNISDSRVHFFQK